MQVVTNSNGTIWNTGTSDAASNEVKKPRKIPQFDIYTKQSFYFDL